MRLPPGAAVSRLTAAWLLGVDGRAPDERDQPLDIECTGPCGTEPLSRPGVRSYVARWRPPHIGLAVADAMAARGLLEVEQLQETVERFRGGAGIARARYLAGAVEPWSESFGESWLRLRVLDAGFPRPEAQVVVLDGGRELYRLDLAWRRRRVALEYDGEEHHSSPADRPHDEHRRTDLERRFDWTLLAVGEGEVLGRSLALERAIGELLGLEPQILRRRW